MKKIKSIKQLKAEKERLRQRKTELEKAIQYDWRDVKDSLRFRDKDEAKENNADFIAEGLSFLAAKFARKAVTKAEEKVTAWFRK